MAQLEWSGLRPDVPQWKVSPACSHAPGAAQPQTQGSLWGRRPSGHRRGSAPASVGGLRRCRPRLHRLQQEKPRRSARHACSRWPVSHDSHRQPGPVLLAASGTAVRPVGALAGRNSGLVLDPARDERLSRSADPNPGQVGSPRRRRSSPLSSPALQRPPGAGSGGSRPPRHDPRRSLGLGALDERAPSSLGQPFSRSRQPDTSYPVPPYGPGQLDGAPTLASRFLPPS